MNYKSKIISIVNNKGGSGKTATVEILSEIFSSIGCRVLKVDLDQSCNLSMVTKRYLKKADNTIKDIFKYKLRNKEDVLNCIQHTENVNVDIIAADREHKFTQSILDGDKISNTSIILKRALDSIREDYDYILIDNSPDNNKLTVNSMCASDYILTPLRNEQFSYEGLETTLETIVKVREDYYMDNLDFLGAFLVGVEPNTNLHKEMVKLCEKNLQEKFLKTYIRKDINIGKMEKDFIPLLELAPNSNALLDYAKLLLETKLLPDDKALILQNAILI